MASLFLFAVFRRLWYNYYKVVIYFMEKFNSTKYKNNFQKEKYDRIIANVPKGQKEIIDSEAKKKGYKSLNSFVVDAINEKLEKYKLVKKIDKRNKEELKIQMFPNVSITFEQLFDGVD